MERGLTYPAIRRAILERRFKIFLKHHLSLEFLIYGRFFFYSKSVIIIFNLEGKLKIKRKIINYWNFIFRFRFSWIFFEHSQ